ncbi:MAG: tetratricopeptide repeat protein [Phycisphaerae bacterium]|nr:tetratricopeptide repeat protein [Phycisphaerae bacterium]
MKSQRRHELLQNTLDSEIAKLKEFFRRYGSKLSWGLLIVAVIVFGVVLWNRRAEQKRAEVQYQYDQVRSLAVQKDANRDEILTRLRALSEQDSVPWVAADAALTLGRVYAVEALTAPTGKTRKLALDAAQTSYQRVIDAFDDYPVAVAGAQLGLGKLEETQDQLEAARKRYQLVLDMPGLDGYPVKTLAQEALHQLDSLEGKPIRLATTLPAWLEAQRKAETDATPEKTEGGS